MKLSYHQPPSPGSVVDKGVLQQCAENKEDTDPRPDVHRLGVGHGWQGALDGGEGSTFNHKS